MSEAKCRQCGCTWLPRVSEPKVCPRCHSYKWNMPKRKVTYEE